MLYKVYFKWKGKDLSIKARSLDMTHPYFVSIKDLIFTRESHLVIDPSEDEVEKQFGESDHIMIPFQTVTLIEEIINEKRNSPMRVRIESGREGHEAES